MWQSTHQEEERERESVCGSVWCCQPACCNLAQQSERATHHMHWNWWQEVSRCKKEPPGQKNGKEHQQTGTHIGWVARHPHFPFFGDHCVNQVFGDRVILRCARGTSGSTFFLSFIWTTTDLTEVEVSRSGPRLSVEGLLCSLLFVWQSWLGWGRGGGGLHHMESQVSCSHLCWSDWLSHHARTTEAWPPPGGMWHLKHLLHQEGQVPRRTSAGAFSTTRVRKVYHLMVAAGKNTSRGGLSTPSTGSCHSGVPWSLDESDRRTGDSREWKTVS